MSIFVISFRVHEDSTYDERYESLVEKIKDEAIGDSVADVWDETTSFFIIQSSKSSKSLCDDLYMGSKISEEKDILLVINLSQKGYAQRGAQYQNILRALMDKR
jgi:hypothetical protein